MNAMILYEDWQAKTADADLLQRCKKAIRAAIPDADVIVYGSRARGDAASDSDYDILVLVDRAVNTALKEQLISCIYPLELESGAVLTLMAYSRDRWNSELCQAMPFRENVEREGVLL
jgi:predicted nucleotidyltransferase